MGNWKKIKERHSLPKGDAKILKNHIKEASKQRFPNRGYKEEFYMDESKEIEQPAFVEGAEWAILEFGLEPSDYIKNQIELLEWLQNTIFVNSELSSVYSNEELVERFNLQRK